MTSSLVPQTPTECPLCEGTGWKTLEYPDRASRVTRCDCRISARADKLLKAAHLPARYEHCTFAEFDGVNRSLANARLIAGRFVEEYPIERTGLLLIGPIGVGKTHLAVSIVQELIRSKGVPCLFYDYRELLKQILNSYNPSVQTTELEILRPVFDAEVLVLDELGAVKPTEWVWDAVQFILNSRYNSQLTTIITTNYSFEAEIKQEDGEPVDTFQKKRAGREFTLGDRIGNRMMSRLQEMCRVVQMDGSDFRQRVQRANFR
jgi:DNA replication protein DnaC